MATSTVIGIDPGTCITGYGIVKYVDNKYIPIGFGCIRPPKKLPLSKRYLIIFQSIKELIKKFLPTSLAVETQFVKKNPQSALKLGMARASILLAAEICNIEIYEYAPKQAKLAVVGNGAATKQQVQKMIQM